MTQTQAAARTRTFSWTDPSEHVKLLTELSGLEFLRAMSAGEVPPPPIFQLIDGSSLHAEDGSVTITLDPQEFHYNPIGTVHGGVISTLLDTAAACSVQTTLPVGVGYTSMDLNVKFLRAVTVDSGTLTCTGAVLQRGRRTALAEARLTDAKGRLVAHATSTCLILDLPTP
ncbi:MULTISPECIES: PaaI family thioesterase [Actinoplanes]|uniref:Aromatic compound degradation protein PaaI n=2 Tax=Actinoplanes TaxID=1865 RepID=A0A0X3V911_9ACTN|nr:MULTISPECIES: PaaI family thioesterase [Actinoplanes]KUL41293.1 aromatic compound degradation protein PaaI [Actinoplanes awajinensis subsp. mycoplanecinus]GIE67917.1 thioesterase [Actinoplanes palleronii]